MNPMLNLQAKVNLRNLLNNKLLRTKKLKKSKVLLPIRNKELLYLHKLPMHHKVLLPMKRKRKLNLNKKRSQSNNNNRIKAKKDQPRKLLKKPFLI